MLETCIQCKAEVHRLIYRNSPSSATEHFLRCWKKTKKEWKLLWKEEMIPHEQLSIASAVAAKTKKRDRQDTRTQWVPDGITSNYNLISLTTWLTQAVPTLPGHFSSPLCSHYPHTTESVGQHNRKMENWPRLIFIFPARSIPLSTLSLNPTKH